jgi:hypothetical protein
MPSKHMSLPKTKLNFVVVKAPVKLCRRLSGIIVCYQNSCQCTLTMTKTAYSENNANDLPFFLNAQSYMVSARYTELRNVLFGFHSWCGKIFAGDSISVSWLQTSVSQDQSKTKPVGIGCHFLQPRICVRNTVATGADCLNTILMWISWSFNAMSNLTSTVWNQKNKCKQP